MRHSVFADYAMFTVDRLQF